MASRGERVERARLLARPAQRLWLPELPQRRSLFASMLTCLRDAPYRPVPRFGFPSLFAGNRSLRLCRPVMARGTASGTKAGTKLAPSSSGSNVIRKMARQWLVRVDERLAREEKRQARESVRQRIQMVHELTENRARAKEWQGQMLRHEAERKNAPLITRDALLELNRKLDAFAAAQARAQRWIVLLTVATVLLTAATLLK